MKYTKKIKREIDMGMHDRESCFEKMYCDAKSAVPGFPCVCSCHANIYKIKEVRKI